jgi:hypothetical protein
MTDIAIRRYDCAICRDTVDVPVDVMGAFADMPERLAEALRATRRDEFDGWSPQFIAIHLADLEVSRGWRIRRILAEDGPLVGSMDQDALAERLHYGERDLGVALETFSANRASNVELVRLAGDAGLSRPYQHPQFGQLTLGILVDHTADHDLAHLRQIVGSVA